VRTVLLVILGAAAFALASTATAAAPAPGGSAAATPMEAYARPGRLVTLPDRRRINLRCTGRGSPTVLLEAGFGAWSFAWNKVQPAVARVTRVCAYDRAGYGFSDPGPLPRDGAAIARDLDRALQASGVRGPFILAGHSAGGLYVRLFAARRLHEIDGMVLLDPTVERAERRSVSTPGEVADGLEPIRRRVIKCLDAARSRQTDVAGCVPKVGGPHTRAMSRVPATWTTQLSELDTLLTDTSDQVDRVGDLLKDVPVIVFTASSTGLPARGDDPGVAMRQELQRKLAAQFDKGDQRIVRSSHLVMNDRPEVVVAAILELVDASRPRRPVARLQSEAGPARGVSRNP
jgi:pimeloyl-ACP methyl ester carboxylesterase